MMVIYKYIAPGQGQTTPWGKLFFINAFNKKLGIARLSGEYSQTITDLPTHITGISNVYAFLLQSIMLTSPCNVDPLTPNFYIVEPGFTGVFIFFLFLL